MRSMHQGFDVLIVGSGHGGAHTAICLRQQKYQGSIAIVSAELDYPYERPPLSKEYFSGEKEFERILIRPVSFWKERGVTMLLGRHVLNVDVSARAVACDDGLILGYRRLVWAAGGQPRRLSCPGHNLRSVHTIRSRADVDRIVLELPNARRIAVIGGGYIGLEAAAVLSKMGKMVTVLEAQERVLSRVAGEALSKFYEAEHRAHGVELRLNATITRIEGGDEVGVSGVRLASGELVPCDMVLVGIGITPSIDPLCAAGAQAGNGVVVDEYGRTSLPDVFAVGDCALHSGSYSDGRTIRLESVQNANDLASTVASKIAGDPVAYDSVPWFWSNQYDLRLQTVGLSEGHDAAVIRGDASSRSFSIVYLRRGHVIALDCVNAVRDYVQGRALVERRAVIDTRLLADVEVPLKELLAR